MCTYTDFYYICGCFAYSEIRHLCEWAEVDGKKNHPVKTTRGAVTENCEKHPSTGESHIDCEYHKPTQKDKGLWAV